MWNKVDKYSWRNRPQRAARSAPAVARNRSGNRVATLILPEEYVTGAMASIYSDGNGKLAFAMGRKGDYVVAKSGPGAKAKKIVIPAIFAERIPYGTTDATLHRDGDMLVLDLNQFAELV